MEEKNKTNRRSRTRLVRKRFPFTTARLELIKQTTLAIVIEKVCIKQLVLVIEDSQPNNDNN